MVDLRPHIGGIVAAEGDPEVEGIVVRGLEVDDRQAEADQGLAARVPGEVLDHLLLGTTIQDPDLEVDLDPDPGVRFYPELG